MSFVISCSIDIVDYDFIKDNKLSASKILRRAVEDIRRGGIEAVQQHLNKVIKHRDKLVNFVNSKELMSEFLDLNKLVEVQNGNI